MKIGIEVAYDAETRNADSWRVADGAAFVYITSERVYVTHEYESGDVKSDVESIANVAAVAALCPVAVAAQLMVDDYTVLYAELAAMRDSLVAVQDYLMANDDLRHCFATKDNLILAWVSGETASYRVLPGAVYSIIAEYESTQGRPQRTE